jgi:hypothetical protein
VAKVWVLMRLVLAVRCMVMQDLRRLLGLSGWDPEFRGSRNRGSQPGGQFIADDSTRDALTLENSFEVLHFDQRPRCHLHYVLELLEHDLLVLFR